MPTLFTTVDDLEMGKANVALQVRLIRSYNLPDFKNPAKSYCHECIFHDKKGIRLCASIMGPAINKFSSMLHEGNVYCIMNFIVTHNSMKYRVSQAKHKILIFDQTRLCEVSDETFPMEMFNFKKIEDILKINDVYEAYMFDVMAMIVSCSALQIKQINEKETRLMDVILADNDGQTIQCTLWDKYADELANYLNNNAKMPISTVIQFCRPNIYRGEIRLSSAFHTTKLFLDTKDVGLAEFKNSFMLNGSFHEFEKMPSYVDHSNVKKELTDDKNIKTIAQLNQLGDFWVFATIFAIESISDWSYLACKKCAKKLTPSIDKFFCQKCNSYEVNGKKRYKLTVRMIDDEDSTASFLLWDRECLILVGKDASAIDKDGNLEHLPIEIENLAGKKALFNVQVKEGQNKEEFDGPYSVNNIILDPKVLSRISGLYVNVQDVNNQHTEVKGKETVMVECDQPGMVLKNEEGQQSKVKVNGKEKLMAESDQTMMVLKEDDMSNKGETGECSHNAGISSKRAYKRKIKQDI